MNLHMASDNPYQGSAYSTHGKRLRIFNMLLSSSPVAVYITYSHLIIPILTLASLFLFFLANENIGKGVELARDEAIKQVYQRQDLASFPLFSELRVRINYLASTANYDCILSGVKDTPSKLEFYCPFQSSLSFASFDLAELSVLDLFSNKTWGIWILSCTQESKISVVAEYFGKDLPDSINIHRLAKCQDGTTLSTFSDFALHSYLHVDPIQFATTYHVVIYHHDSFELYSSMGKYASTYRYGNFLGVLFRNVIIGSLAVLYLILFLVFLFFTYRQHILSMDMFLRSVTLSLEWISMLSPIPQQILQWIRDHLSEVIRQESKFSELIETIIQTAECLSVLTKWLPQEDEKLLKYALRDASHITIWKGNHALNSIINELFSGNETSHPNGNDFFPFLSDDSSYVNDISRQGNYPSDEVPDNSEMPYDLTHLHVDSLRPQLLDMKSLDKKEVISPHENHSKHTEDSGLTQDADLSVMVPDKYEDISCWITTTTHSATFLCARLIFQPVDNLDLISYSSSLIDLLKSASAVFCNAICKISEQFGGKLFNLSSNYGCIAWNVNLPTPFHESHGCRAALQLGKLLSPLSENIFQHPQMTFFWTLVLNSAPVSSGFIIQDGITFPILEGEGIEFANECCDLGPLLEANILVLEANYVISRQHMFAIPIDRVKKDRSVSVVFQLEGYANTCEKEYYLPLFEGFTFLQLNELEHAAIQLKKLIDKEPTARRIHIIVTIFQRLTAAGYSHLLPRPYLRIAPRWELHELAAESEPLDKNLLQLLSSKSDGSEGSRGCVNSYSSTTRKKNSATVQAMVKREMTEEIKYILSLYLRRKALTVSLEEQDMNSAVLPSVDTAILLPPIGASWELMKENKSSETKEGILSEKSIGFTLRDAANVKWHALETPIGVGAFGHVYEGFGEDGTKVAIKEIPLQLKDLSLSKLDAITDSVGASLTELSLLSSLRHNNIVRYISSSFHDLKLYIILEYISGGSLQFFLDHFCVIPESIVRIYFRDILKGVQYLHDEGVIHCDISTKNVLVSTNGVCKLADFGGAKFLQKGGEGSAASTILGTPAFMSPEACRGVVSKENDIWSIGILFYCCLTGVYPWSNDILSNPAEVIRLIGRYQLLPRIDTSRIRNPDAINFIESCLNINSALRPTASDLLSHNFFVNS